MATQDPIPCQTCGMLPSQCSCIPANVLSFHYGKTSNGWTAAPPPPSHNWTLTPTTQQFVTNSDLYWHATPVACNAHQMNADEIKLVDGEIHGVCAVCNQEMIVPHVIGGFAFERAGTLIGHALALDPEDEAQLGELLAELNLLEQKIAKEQARYRTTLGMIKIARDRVTGLISEGSTIE